MSFTWWNWSRSPPVGDAVGPVHDQRHVDAAFVGVLLVPLERGVAGLGPTPRVVGVAVGPADVVEVRSTASSGVSARKLKYFISCMTPKGRPPGWRRCRTSGGSGCCRAGPARRGRRRAGRSGRRCARGRRRRPPGAGRPAAWWFSGRESHGSTPGLRGASSVSGGSRPISCCRANHRRGRRPSPSSKRPRYFSRYSAGAWWGACMAPKAR
jgi:hypothetical protein